MNLPIESAALEVVANDGELNIRRGKIEAYKALRNFVLEGTDIAETLFENVSVDDDQLRDINLMSYNSIRNNWIGMYVHWKYPDLFVNVQYVNGSIYTQVNRYMRRDSDHSQAELW